MSTRCRIGYVRPDGLIESIYCHYNGHEDGVGSTLRKYYTDIETIKKLMLLGDISSLGYTPVSNKRAWESNPVDPWESPEEWIKHWNLLHPKELCDTYAMRGEYCPAQIATTEAVYLEQADTSWADYCYLFRDGAWLELLNANVS